MVQVKYVSFLSLLSPPLLKSQVVLRAETGGLGGVKCKVKEEKITQDTLQIKVSVRWSAVIHHAAGRARRPALPSEGLKSSPRVRAVMKMKLLQDKFLVTNSSLLICKRLRDDSGLPGYHRPPHCFSLRSIFFFLPPFSSSSAEVQAHCSPEMTRLVFPCRLLKCLHSCKWRWWFGVVARCSPTGFNSHFRDKYASRFNRETGAGFHTDGKLLVALFVFYTWLTKQLKVINKIVVLVARLWLMFLRLQLDTCIVFKVL